MVEMGELKKLLKICPSVFSKLSFTYLDSLDSLWKTYEEECFREPEVHKSALSQISPNTVQEESLEEQELN